MLPRKKIPHKLKLPGKKLFLEIIALFLLIGLFVFLLFKYFPDYIPFNLFNKPDSSSIPASFPPPCTFRPLPRGKQIYHYSHGKDVVGPKLQVVTIDPFDPQPDQTINITAEIKHDSRVTKATAILITDNQITPQEMTLTSSETTNGTWTASIKLEDTNLCTYQLKFDLQSETGNYNDGMVFRPWKSYIQFFYHFS